MAVFVQVALKVAHNNGIFCYQIDDNHDENELLFRRVKVTLRTRTLTGLIVEVLPKDFAPSYTVKKVQRIIDEKPVISQQQALLIQFCHRYYVEDLGICYSLAIPKNETPYKKKDASKPKKAFKEIVFSDAQQVVWEHVQTSPQRAFLLQGITGSGKTLIYLKAAQEALKHDKGVIFLVPEISLTTELIKRVEESLGERVVAIHSNISSAKKRDAMHELLEGRARVAIGARSAVFAPMKNLGLIVVDEEHDASFKQEESPRYHGRDLALWRAQHENARIILGSATPSLESLLNTQNGKLVHLRLSERFQKLALPKVTIIDLKERAMDVDHRMKDQSQSLGQKMCIISRPLKEAMVETFGKEQQVLLFLNQRGYAKFGVCYDCGNMVQCPNCSIGLTLYQKRQMLSCHLCLYEEPCTNQCRHCLKNNLRYLGLGTERLQEEVSQLFPDKRVVRLDRDVVQSQLRLNETLRLMHEKEADILIGTQMVTKGHDFKHLGLVGVICADVALSVPDFRAAERTFQMLTQVSGRAGRHFSEGQAFIQTFNPNHPSIQMAKDHDVDQFIHYDLAVRKSMAMPPFRKSAIIRAEHKEQPVAEQLIFEAHKLLSRAKGIDILGPAPCMIERINDRFRFQCFLLADSAKVLNGSLWGLHNKPEIATFVNSTKARLIIDVDPQQVS